EYDGGHVKSSWRPCSAPPRGRQQARDAMNLARVRPLSQSKRAKSAIGRNNSLVNGVCRPPAAQSTSLMRHTQKRPMLRVASSIGPSPLIAAENSERIALFVCVWHSTDLPILHNHVRLAWRQESCEPSEHFR